MIFLILALNLEILLSCSGGGRHRRTKTVQQPNGYGANNQYHVPNPHVFRPQPPEFRPQPPRPPIGPGPGQTPGGIGSPRPFTTASTECVPSCGNIRIIKIRTGTSQGDQLANGKLSLEICSKPKTCCAIDHLKNKGRQDFQLNREDEFEGISGLRNCHKFHLPFLEKLRIQMTDGQWRGQYLKLFLDNGTTIDCPIDSKLQHQDAVRLEYGCKLVHVSK